MAQNTTNANGLTVKSAIRAGRLRADQPDPPNRGRKTRKRGLVLAQFGVNAHGVPTYTKA